MSSSIRKALILAAGKGTRMANLTREIPKPMLPIDGKPILEHVLDRLRAAGVEQACLVIGYHGDLIRQHFASYPIPLRFELQQAIDGTGSAALLGRAFCGDDPFLLTFGDILCAPEDYEGLAAALTGGVSAVLGVKYVEDPAAGAAVYEENGRVTAIVEKPVAGTSKTHWNSAGVYAFTSAVFPQLEQLRLSPRGEYELTSAVSQMIDAGQWLRKYAIHGQWMDVGRPEDLDRAQGLVRQRS